MFFYSKKKKNLKKKKKTCKVCDLPQPIFNLILEHIEPEDLNIHQ